MVRGTRPGEGWWRYTAVVWVLLLIMVPVTGVAGAIDAGATDARATDAGAEDTRTVASGAEQPPSAPSAADVPGDRGLTNGSIHRASQTAPDSPACGKAAGSVSGKAVPTWVNFICTESTTQSSTFRIEMREAWLYVVKIQAPQDASASQILNGTTQTLVNHGLPTRKVAPWGPVYQRYGKESGKVTFLGHFASGLDTQLGSVTEVGVWGSARSQASIELTPGVYQVQVIAIEPFVSEAETFEDLSPEEMTQLAVSGGDRKRASLVLESGGCVAGYDPRAHYRTLKEQERTLRQDLESLKGEFERTADEFGVSVGMFAGAVMLTGVGMSGMTVTVGGTAISGSSSAVGKAAEVIGAANDGLTAIGAGNAFQTGKQLVRKMFRVRHRLMQTTEEQIDVLEEISRCAGGQYLPPADGGT